MSIAFAQQDLGEHATLPVGWEWVALGEVCRVVGGSTPSSAHQDYWGGPVVWVTPTDLGRIKGRIIEKSERTITHKGLDSCGTVVVPPGSVILSSRAPIGHLAIAGVPLCTNQGCKTFIPTARLDSKFLFFALKRAVPTLKALGSGATFTEISKARLEAFPIPLPPIDDQRRIVAMLDTQLAVVERARMATEAQLKGAKALSTAYLRATFNSHNARNWPRRPLAQIAILLPSKSISSAGDREVRTITTACLTESGFNPSGVKVGRMWTRDAAKSLVAAGEILVARSNTPELVGRAALFRGETNSVVASDLTIRIQMRAGFSPEFMAAYLSFLYLTGYWKDRAGGASGTMKKITRSQIQAELVPTPDYGTQLKVAEEIAFAVNAVKGIASAAHRELAAINALPKSLIDRAFIGKP